MWRIRASEAQFWVTLGPKYVKIPIFGYFLQKFPLVSHQYCFICSLQVLLDVWRIRASEAQFWVTLGPKYVKIPIFGHCLIISTGFASVLVYMSIWFSFRGVEYRPQRPTFRVILGHEIDHNSGLPSFSKIFSTGFTSFWFYMFIGGTFRCISMMCPKGPISGPRVKVIAVIT